jgi:hypothetical protein
MTHIDTAPPALDTLDGIHDRAVELTGIAHGLDVLAVDACDSKGLRHAFTVLARLVLERATELDQALDRLSLKEGQGK